MENEKIETGAETKEEPQAEKPRQKKKFRIRTKDIALAAVLTGLSIALPYFMPTIIIPPDMSVTLLSHTTVFIAMFINPVTAILTCLGTLLAFVIKVPYVAVWIRAASHMVFAVIGSFVMYKWKKGYRGVSFYALCGIVTLIHMVAEILSAMLAIAVGAKGAPPEITFRYVVVVVGLVTVAHSLFDYTFAVLIYNTLSQARLVNNKFDLRIARKPKPKPELLTPNS